MTTALPTSPLKLHPIVLENPAERLLHHQRKSKLYFTAMIISAICALTIFGSLTATYLGLLAETSLSGWGTFCVMGAGIGSMVGVDHFMNKHTQEKPKIAGYQAINEQWSRIQHWDAREIQQFLPDHNQSVPRPEAMALLQQKSPASPLRALLPLIARIQVTVRLFNQWDHKYLKHTQEIERLRSVATTPLKLIAINEFVHKEAENHRTYYAEKKSEYLQLLANPVIG